MVNNILRTPIGDIVHETVTNRYTHPSKRTNVGNISKVSYSIDTFIKSLFLFGVSLFTISLTIEKSIFFLIYMLL